MHNRIMGVDQHGEKQLPDLLIRTHGTPAYRSVKRGESAGGDVRGDAKAVKRLVPLATAP